MDEKTKAGPLGTSSSPAPGDDAAPGATGAGENVCRECGGSGRLDGGACQTCQGTGKVIEGIGGG
jgi:hypothetical protein